MKVILILLFLFGIIWGMFIMGKTTLFEASVISISTIIGGIVGEYAGKKFGKK